MYNFTDLSICGTSYNTECRHAESLARVGVWWRVVRGGGCVVGGVEEDTGELSGPDIVYLYPDFR